MLFYSPEFLVFSLILIALLAIFQRNSPRKVVLLLASYVFYMWWNPAFILLIVFTTAVNYACGLAIGIKPTARRRKLWLVIGLTASLGVLAFFKYCHFMEDNALAVMRLLGYNVSWAHLNITLPVGISFYTFQTLSYTIDVYRGQIPVCRSPIDFALFVAFFPQLVAGPIVRAADFLPQLRRPVPMCFDRTAFFLIARGMVKKVLVADNLAVLADAVFTDVGRWPSVIIWIATLCFYVQIYCDFSGYSDIAIGVARALGYYIPINFNRPYFAMSPAEFWHRWHISLSTWLRDYLYIPLGGNRHGPFKTGRNLMITMLLGGLWHGASWNFVLWGGLHGVALVGHRIWTSLRPSSIAPRGRLWTGCRALLSWAVLQYWVLLTWLIFRITDTADLLVALRKFVVFDMDFAVKSIGLGSLSVFSSLLILAAFAIVHAYSFWRGGLDRRLAHSPLWISCSVSVLLGTLFYFFWPLSEAPFIYFQF
ncbi:MAG: MBOAT family protein [Pirellulales bacterium]|nr:MBOAT family protein [Pirellulales bacterium]